MTETTSPFTTPPDDHECEKASNGYVMSLMAIMAGLPFPVINLIATGIFYFGNLKSTPFVRWHCTQALFSQAAIFGINVTGVWWGLSILFGPNELTNTFIAYFITAILFNIAESAATIFTAVKVRRGIHVELWVFGPLTHLVFSHEK